MSTHMCEHSFVECPKKVATSETCCDGCVLQAEQERCFERGLLLPDDVVHFCSKCGELKRDPC